ncbi:hypothetical protein IAR55_004230 [Kwoniella newhampshirensis]|uniref:N-acetyltransferase domain-containing protein n=1 Tax=Kwoniella newhampshirensis TaxID=1651941 RepID=A0AAW0YK83_9TREE
MTHTHPYVIEGPIPYVPISPPHDAYCFTGHIPSDVQHLPAIVNQPSIKATLGYPHDMTDELALAWIERCTTGPRFADFPFHVIRKIQDLGQPSPEIVGFFALGRENYHCFGDRRAELTKKNADLPSEEAQYQITFFIDGAHEGRGLVTAAGRTAIRFHPHIRHRPGQLSSAYLSHNLGSAAVHRKLGFKTIARAKDVFLGHDALCEIWIAEGSCDKKRTIYAEFEDIA